MIVAEFPGMVRIPMPDPVSNDDIVRIGKANLGWRVERLGANVVTMSPTGRKGGNRNQRLAKLLDQWNDALAQPGEAFDSQTGFNSPDGSLISGDWAWMSKERWAAIPAEECEGFGSGKPHEMPQIVIELLSFTDRPKDIVEKCERWSNNAVDFVVFIDPYRHDVKSWGGFADTAARDALLAIAEEIAGS